MKDVRVGLSTLLFTSAIVGAGAFAAGRSTSPSSSSSPAVTITSESHEPHESHESHEPHAAQPGLPMGHPPTGGGMAATPPTDDLPPGHPSIDDQPQQPPTMPAAPAADTGLAWKVPARWVIAPNTSSMRLATYRIPRAAGDSADAEVSVTQAGGALQANVDRWIDQFGPEAKKTAKQATKKVAGLDVTLVDVEGTFGGGMAMGPGAGTPENKAGWALLGAIVATPDMPHFIKITGPKKTVQSARTELDELLASMTTTKSGTKPAPSR